MQLPKLPPPQQQPAAPHGGELHDDSLLDVLALDCSSSQHAAACEAAAGANAYEGELPALSADDLAAHLTVRPRCALAAALGARGCCVCVSGAAGSVTTCLLPCCPRMHQGSIELAATQPDASKPGSWHDDLLLLGWDCEADAAECAAVADATNSYEATDDVLAAAGADAAAEHISSTLQLSAGWDSLAGAALGSSKQLPQARWYFKSPCKQHATAESSRVYYKNSANAPAWSLVRCSDFVACTASKHDAAELTCCHAAGGHVTCLPDARHSSRPGHGALRARHLSGGRCQQLVALRAQHACGCALYESEHCVCGLPRCGLPGRAEAAAACTREGLLDTECWHAACWCA